MIFRTKVDKLTIKNTKQNYQSYVYIAPEELKDAAGLGQLFIVVEIKSKEKKVPDMLNQIVDEISEYYYHSPTKNVEAALETTCQYFNENILDITGKKMDWVKDKVHILIAAVQEDKLVLSSYQNIKVWLLREGKIHDIIGTQNKPKRNNSKKFMSQLISGQLENEDVLMMTNPTIFDYFSDEKIKKTISTLAPTQACAFFKNTLLDYDVSVDFSTVIVKFFALQKEDQDMNVAYNDDILDNGSDNMALRQKQANKLMEAAKAVGGKIGKGSVTALKYTKEGVKKIKNNKIKKEDTYGEVSEMKEEVDSEGVNVLDNKSGLGTLEKQTLFQKIIKRLKLSEYRLVVMFVFLAIVFAGSLIMINKNKESEAEKENFQEMIAEIDTRMESIEAALIYKDESKAQELLQEARSLISGLVALNDDEEYQVQEMEDKLEEFVNKVYKLDKISDLDETLMATLPNEFSPTSNVFEYDDNFYLAKGVDLYRVNEEDKSVDNILSASHNIIKIMPYDSSKVLLYGGNRNMSLADLSNDTVRSISVEDLGGGDEVAQVNSYASKLYALSGDDIYKYTYSNSTFVSPSKWNEEESDLAGNTSMAIDGSIWLAARDGEITKLFRGQREVFSLKGVYEKIGENTNIYTSDTVSNIYLVDEDKNRIIVADKEGRVTNQLLGEDMPKIISVLPNDDEDTLYVLTDERLFSIGF